MCCLKDEAEVEALLKQIALAKQKELRLRAEKKRVRDEMGQLQAVRGRTEMVTRLLVGADCSGVEFCPHRERFGHGRSKRRSSFWK